ncbi:GNAT family N-acetyltransferase [Demequina sediminicola]|uniref:GNAT family N-acetyltransferase n=1 Tax=Demequina sediminicola TaxID=1095026 RepID=UPI0009E60DD7|nr:GNAT family protein [Demequina sediminicola]
MTRPQVLTRGPLTVRAFSRSDEQDWRDLRARNRAWLHPWEAQTPPGSRIPSATFPTVVRRDRRQWRDDAGYPAVIEFNGLLVGRVSVFGIQWGAAHGASIGYWIDQEYAGRGIVPTAVAMLSSFAFERGMHRLEIAVRPENDRSLAVAKKLGFTEEGMRRSYLFIDGQWRDHVIFFRTQDQARVGRYWEEGR